MKVLITRIAKGEKQTLGHLQVLDEAAKTVFNCQTLELPWKDNKRRESCIPTGTYKVSKRFSEKYKNHFHIKDVPGRSMILIHNANYVRQLLGCIAVGEKHYDINGDGLKDVTNSVLTMKRLDSILPKHFELEIR